MPFVQADLDAWDRAWLNNEQGITAADGRRIDFKTRTHAEYIAGRNFIQGQIAAADGTPQTRITLVSHSRG